ncbi:DUF192 domain-containing protein [Qipengyuania sp. 1NDH17]|uniref:DUF192 domain-containing protein n=1 Tax=Qipengyuania polymorpha TaxID=2867234 RepID=A0ABS7IXK0_9SPHN|nr:DUF192 domain-containing protein [Qipengyuania polymorpha]MBX7458285.1 DUF192 domain-containing protein [Qipengyuania polymorpha]
MAAALAGLAMACSPQAATDENTVAAAQSSTHPVSGLEIVPVVVSTGENSYEFRAELADTKELQAKGLMHRTQLGRGEAMLFPSEQPTARSFWMKNTPIPLDIIFVGLDGRITNIAAMTEPYSEEPVYSVGSVSAVLEIAGGRAEELGIEPGDSVSW